MPLNFQKSYFPNIELRDLVYDINDSLYRAAGAGGFYNTLQTVIRNVDRFRYNMAPVNYEHSGNLFITRPRMNLTSASLRTDRILSSLDTYDPMSHAFAVRCLLDPRYAQANSAVSALCPWLNLRSPWMTNIMNSTQSMSGWPDLAMDVETTPGGFHSEDITFPKGFDRLSRTYDFSLNIRDIQGGFNMMMLMYWFYAIASQVKGETIAYADDRYYNRMNFTVSMYRFTLDPSRRFIQKTAKATGCFIKAVPIGNCFNLNEGEVHTSAAMKFSINATVNKVEYLDYAIVADFNRLANRYYPGIANLPSLPLEAASNGIGLPYIQDNGDGLELCYKAPINEWNQTRSSELKDRIEEYIARNVNDTDVNPDTAYLCDFLGLGANDAQALITPNSSIPESSGGVIFT